MPFREHISYRKIPITERWEITAICNGALAPNLHTQIYLSLLEMGEQKNGIRVHNHIKTGHNILIDMHTEIQSSFGLATLENRKQSAANMKIKQNKKKQPKTP